jgi:Major Facilitator Superfamily
VSSRRAIAATFVANGLGGPSFLARIPERQEDLGLSDARLGLVLGGLALGALLASRAAGRAVSAAGSRTVVVVAGLTLGGLLWTAGAAPTAPVLFAALLAIGAADAAMDIAMNTNGSAFEVRAGRSILHGLHAAWSLGALAAGAVAALAAARGLPLTVHLALTGAVIVTLVVVSRPGLVGEDHHFAASDEDAGPSSTGRGRRRPWRGPLVVIAAATVGGAIIEGAPVDWGAVQLERFGVERGASSLAVAAFMAGMVGGRLVGDRATDRFGPLPVLRGGMILVVAGIGLGAATAQSWVFALGLLLAGAGASGLFPLVFSSATRIPGVPPGAGAATVSLAARIGFLVEPLLIGALAEWIGLRGAFTVVAAVAACLALVARRVVR